MTNEDFKQIGDDIPHLPGVYRFIDAEGKILYVGKAKDLRNRLSNYFGDKKQAYYKTRVMVQNASKIEFTIVDSEHDALLLENSYIKRYQPRFNVNLKDGKNYSYICIKNERFPRVFFTRKIYKDGSLYFGPFTSKYRVKQILELVKKLFPLRTCSYNLSEENISKSKFKVCLEYHIKNCMGACEGLESEETYLYKIEQIKNILKGNFSLVKEFIIQEMNNYADQLHFEKAQEYKEKLELFEDYQAKSTVVNAAIGDVDVFAIRKENKSAFVNYMKVNKGALIYTDTHELEINLDENLEDLLGYAVLMIREKYKSNAPEVVIPLTLDLPGNFHITVPQRGEKKKLLELAHKNLDYFLMLKKKEEINRSYKIGSHERIIKTLQSDLRMDNPPFHIECFDNSNLGGTDPVASCVVFKNGKPSKKDYRHFKIKTVEGPNDFASMEEIVYRRYKRLLEEGEALPQLVIIDGGKGQLSAAVKSLERLEIMDKLTVIGIAKKLEEIFFPGDPLPLYINKKSESLKIIQQCRNEAHRFAISFHRDIRSKNFIKTELNEIPGIGPKTAELLLREYGSLKVIKSLGREELEKVLGKKLSEKVINFFSDQEI